MISSIWIIIAATFVVCLLLSALVIRAGLGDIPDHRSNHDRVTTTGGGIAIIGALAVLFLLLTVTMPTVLEDKPWPQLLSLIWMVGFLGLMDDVYTISTPLKFFILACVCALSVWVIGPVTALPYALQGVELPYWFGFVGSVLWLFLVTNAVNFMDGSNGLMATVMSVALGALIFVCLILGASDIIWMAVALLTGLLAFLPFNFGNRARVFCGDVGSLTIGFGFALTGLWLCTEAPQSLPVFIAPVLILPVLADVLLTMFRRARRGENLLQAHSTHLYQRMIRHGRSHMFVACIYGCLTLLFAAYTIALVRFGYQSFLSFLMMPTAICFSAYMIISRRLRLADNNKKDG